MSTQDAQTQTQQPEAEEGQLKLAIPDVYVVAQALEVSIKRKTFNEEEIQKVYAPWSRVLRFCEDIRRKTEVEELYKKTEEEPKPKLKTVKEE